MINENLVENLFKDEINNSYLFHIPHSSKQIPHKTNFIVDNIDKELDLLTDIDTDQIFNIPNTTKLIFPFSRLYCDVERLDDDNEPMETFGRGFYYRKTDCGKILRNLSEKDKKDIYENHYKQHHNKLKSIVDEKIKKYGFVNIVDCHSFNDTPLKSDLIQTIPRPDICIGVDDFHTPQDMVNRIKKVFEQENYVVKINNPYSGTIVPIEYYGKRKEINSIMIEINKKTYVENNVPCNDKIEKLNQIIKSIFIH